MKHIATISAVLASLLVSVTIHAAVPLRWTVDTSRLAPAAFDVVRGETIALEASFNSAGKPFAMDAEPVSIFWQTNGMGSAWWTAPAAAESNRVSATFTPEMDPGAATVIGFLGSSGSIYRAAFTFRFRHGPGAVPNTLPLPVPVIDFAKVRVLNPPWSGGGVETNAVRDIIRDLLATNGIRSVDGAARPLPKYLHALDFDDTYPEDAAWYYAQPQDYGACSARRTGNVVERNYDWKFDDAAEFVVKVSCSSSRFASVGVANVGTNLTEEIVTSGKWSRYYKCLPGRVVDGINENGVVCEVNVVDGDPQTSGWHTGGDIHPLGAVRWALDNGTSAGMVASNLAARIAFPAGWTQNFHWMIADERETWIVENGAAHLAESEDDNVLTNFARFPFAPGPGLERYSLLAAGDSITNVWYTNAYRRDTSPPWVSDLAEVIAYTNEIFDAWAAHDKEYFRGKTNNGIPWWQTVHTSVYDITNRTLRVAVQETDDWYTFAVPSAGGVKPEAVREIVEPMIGAATNGVNEAIAGKMDKTGGKFYNHDDFTSIEVGQGVEIRTDAQEEVPYGSISVYGNGSFRASIKKNGKEVATEEQVAAKQDALPYPTNAIPTDSISGLVQKIHDEAPAPGNYAAVSNAAMNAIQAVTNADANLIYTITSDGAEPRFYFTPVGAIDPED